MGRARKGMARPIDLGENSVETKPTTLYCNYNPEAEWKRRYDDFYKNKVAVQVSQSKGYQLIQVIVAQAPEDAQEFYYAWWDVEDQEFMFVYPKDFFVGMCFTYGPEMKEAKGEGKIIRVTIQHAEGDNEIE
jgi:hypothetical protein